MKKVRTEIAYLLDRSGSAARLARRFSDWFLRLVGLERTED